MSQPDRTYRLLIVDDDETDRKLYGWLLARQAPASFAIEHAASGVAGLAALREREFECVLLDFSLPDLTGLEFLGEALVDGELPAAVVLITGHGNEAIAVEAMKLGVQDYLVKDHVNEGRLWRAIMRAVSQRELRHRLSVSVDQLTTLNAALEQEAAARKATEVALRAAKEAAEQADQAKGRFMAMLTRELRVPLASILDDVSCLRNEGSLTPKQSARVGTISELTRRMASLIARAELFADREESAVSPIDAVASAAINGSARLPFVDGAMRDHASGVT